MLATNALTTLEKAKTFLGIDQADTSQDDFLTFSINSVSATIEKYCNRIFALKTFTEFKQGRGSSKLILDNFPIVKVTNVIIDDQVIDVTTIRPLAETGMIYRPTGGFPAFVRGGRFLHPRPDEHEYNVLVEYQAGYVLPKDETAENPRTLPFDIEMACLRMLRIMKKDKEVSEGQNLILKREQIGDWIGEYEPENKSTSAKLDYMDPDILAILDHYKRADFSI